MLTVNIIDCRTMPVAAYTVTPDRYQSFITKQSQSRVPNQLWLIHKLKSRKQLNSDDLLLLH